MNSKRKYLRHANFYVILDAQVNTPGEIVQIAGNLAANGVDLVQLRDKISDAKNIIHLSNLIKKKLKGRIPFIINDRVDVALAVGADGVHLGQDDVPVHIARQMMGKNALIGISCQTAKHLREAQKMDVDYIGFGSIYQTKTKPERKPMKISVIREVVRMASCPVFAIGGITKDNIPPLKNLGIERMAFCREICSSNGKNKLIRQIKQLLNS